MCASDVADILPVHLGRKDSGAKDRWPAPVQQVAPRPVAGKKKSGSEDVGGRNKLIGKVTVIKRDATMAQVDINIGSHKITAAITRDALDELGLRVGDTAMTLVKATEVMVIKN